MRVTLRDEQIGQLYRRTSDLVRRVIEGTLPFEPTMNALQKIIEGRMEPQTARLQEERICVAMANHCSICGALFSEADDICSNGHQIGSSYFAAPQR